MNDNSVIKDDAGQNETLSELLVQMAKTSSVVVHDEIVLVIQRISEMMKAARNGVLLIATGAVIGYTAFLCVCGAMIIGLTLYMSPVFAALVTGSALAILGVAIAFSGFKQFKKFSET